MRQAVFVTGVSLSYEVREDEDSPVRGGHKHDHGDNVGGNVPETSSEDCGEGNIFGHAAMT